jgi:hypothetical protein
MSIKTTDTNSIAVINPKIIDSFISKSDFPFLISFERTGSHWLRMIMELYFEKPSLVRIFYFKDAKDFTCYHHHDEGLNTQRKNVIYLYRHPVDTVYSNLCHYGEDIENRKQIEYRSNLYGCHLKKWLLDENFTFRKTIVTYEGMKKDMANEFKKICLHFSLPFERRKLHDALGKVTKEEVKRKTTHDPRVINLLKDYQIEKEKFKQKQAAFIMDCILSVNPALEKFIKEP